MFELDFHCPECGEENTQLEKFYGEYETETYLTQCDYCSKILEISVRMKYEVSNVSINQ